MRPEFAGKVVKITKTHGEYPIVEEKDGDTLILRVFSHPTVPPEGWGFESIEVENLHKKMEEIYSEENLAEMEASGNMPPGFRKMPLIAVIKSNITGNDSMGWKKHKQTLKGAGFNV